MSDEQFKEQGATLKVGVDQLNNPTPMWLKYIFRTVLYLSALWTLIAPMLTDLSEIQLAEITKWLFIANTAINVAIKFFGWDFTTDRR